MTRPSNKWFVAQITAVGAWLVALINAGWDLRADLQIVAVGIVVQAVATYFVPNDTAPTRAAVKRRVRSDKGYADGGLLILLLVVFLLILLGGFFASKLLWLLLLIVVIVALLG